MSTWTRYTIQRLIAVPGVSDSMVDLLNGLLHINPKKRFTAEEALCKARIIDEVTRRDNRNSTGPVGIAGNGGALASPRALFGTSPNQLTYFPSNPLLSSRQSRYREDFEEVEFLVSSRDTCVRDQLTFRVKEVSVRSSRLEISWTVVHMPSVRVEPVSL